MLQRLRPVTRNARPARVPAIVIAASATEDAVVAILVVAAEAVSVAANPRQFL